MKRNSSAVTLPLFEAEGTIELPSPPLRERMAELEWSYSRRNTLEQCPRRYYFQYYGSNLRKAKTEGDKHVLRELKELNSRHERVGEITHLAIANYFRRVRTGSPQNVDQLLDWAKKLFHADLKNRLGIRGIKYTGDSRFRPARLLEFYYRQDNAEELYKAAEEKMITALTNFAEHPRFERVRHAGCEPEVLVEKKFRLKKWPCKVTGIVDLAGKFKQTPGIVDWKTGEKATGENDSLQLAAYAFWAGEIYDCTPESVTVCKAFLGDGVVVKYPHSTASLRQARMRILQDVERMVAVHPYGMEGRRNVFTPCAQRKVCVLCPYIAACPEGKESLQ